MSGRVRHWIRLLASSGVDTSFPAPEIHERHGILWCDVVAEKGSHPAIRYVAVAADPDGAFPRARRGEVGLLQGWMLAACVREAMEADREKKPRALVSVVDVPSQAYGRREEALCISLALAAAIDAYASARLRGHPTVALIAGKAISGAFLAHGYQSSRLLALDVADIQVHAMGLEAAARITRRTVAELEEAGRNVYPVSYELDAFAQLGILDEALVCSDADQPNEEDVRHVHGRLMVAVAQAARSGGHLSPRLDRGGTGECRELSHKVWRVMEQEWLSS